MLNRLYVDNFLCLVNFELFLDKINVLLGPNGCGKTSVLHVLHKLQYLIARGAKINEVLSAKDLTISQDRNEQRFELDLSINGNSYKYSLSVEHYRNRSRIKIIQESLKHNGKPIFEFNNGNAQLYHDDYTKGPEYPFDWTRSGIGALNGRPDNKKLSQFKCALSNFVVVSPCPPIFRPEARSEDNFFDPRMENLVAWYRHAAQENMGGISELFRALGEVLPDFDSISLTESGENSRALKVNFRRHGDGRQLDRFGLLQLSDGQRALIALYGLLYLSTDRQMSLFIDKPDNYLALREVQPWLAEVDQLCGDKLEQVVVISHHPTTIDYLAGANGRWFFREGTGPVRVSNAPSKRIDGLSISETIARGWDK